jgi:hypothetical protein
MVVKLVFVAGDEGIFAEFNILSTDCRAVVVVVVVATTAGIGERSGWLIVDVLSNNKAGSVK